ncbi:MAG: hypothetical protein O6952_06050 [Planctomycetota bacterium]|nr:hypothetical protein [Planctomycetota bacterium]
MAKSKSASRSRKQSRSRAARRGAAPTKRRIVILPEGMGEEPRLSEEVFFLVDFS